MLKKLLLKLLKYIPAILLLFLVFVNLWLGINRAVTGNPVPKIFGYSSMYVLSGSMEPAIMPGDLVITKEKAVSEYTVGEIVTFVEHSTPCTHRIIARNGDFVTTKGDANNKADEQISISKIEGKVLLRIPKVGAVAMFCKTPPGIAIMFIILIVLLYSGDIIKKFRGKKK